MVRCPTAAPAVTVTRTTMTIDVKFGNTGAKVSGKYPRLTQITPLNKKCTRILCESSFRHGHWQRCSRTEPMPAISLVYPEKKKIFSSSYHDITSPGRQTGSHDRQAPSYSIYNCQSRADRGAIHTCVPSTLYRLISPSPATNTSVMKHVVTLPILLSRTHPIDIPSFLGEYLLEVFLVFIEDIQLVAVVLCTHRKKMRLFAYVLKI